FFRFEGAAQIAAATAPVQPTSKGDRVTRPLLDANPPVQRAVDDAIASGREIGVQVAVYHRGHLVVDAWGGLADPANERPVDGETLFNVYSVTKAVAATAVHMLVDRGRLDYDAPVATWWPEYAAHGKGKTTLGDVLTDRARIPPMPAGRNPERLCDWAWMTREVADLVPLAEPGTHEDPVPLDDLRMDPPRAGAPRRPGPSLARPLRARGERCAARRAGPLDRHPDAVEARIAPQIDAMRPLPAEHPPPLYLASMPPAVALGPSVFERPEVRRAEVAGVGSTRFQCTD